ncbi:MGDG synthase family glycosyltransferase [Brevibacillus marinus]|uniref:MGDG synthase family glycosyltransferase n=1 Tax=Brevibacillus marinus TaxID=2496837 RepID=UPI0013DF5990|nr:glycosyltransferase [Brevibacillus marinus]
MSRKIVICTEEWAGSGHKMAALALAEALREHDSSIPVTTVYGLRTISPLLRKLSHTAYSYSLNRAPQLWQRIYEREKQWGRVLQRPLAAVLGERLLRQLIEPEAPTAVIATHAYCLSALAWAKRRAGKPFQLAVALTDFQLNSFWVNRDIDYYIVSHEHIGEQLTRQFSVEPHRIFPYGIPVRLPFFQENGRTKKEWREFLGLHPARFTVLLASGEAGHSNYQPVVERLLQLDVPLQIAVITGHNQRQLASLRRQYGSLNSRHTLYLMGYVAEIWTWLGAADLLITKPGGITCAEALAMHTPLLLYRPLPGQERRNSRFLQEQGVAYAAETAEEVARIVRRLATEPETWAQAAHKAARLARPDAARRAAELILAAHPLRAKRDP